MITADLLLWGDKNTTNLFKIFFITYTREVYRNQLWGDYWGDCGAYFEYPLLICGHILSIPCWFAVIFWVSLVDQRSYFEYPLLILWWYIWVSLVDLAVIFWVSLVYLAVIFWISRCSSCGNIFGISCLSWGHFLSIRRLRREVGEGETAITTEGRIL